jgi:dihydroxyacetone kinase
MLASKAGPSTMGTLLATALMRAGKVVMGKADLGPGDLVAMLQAAEQGIQERGKAQLGDKTILDALHPAVEAFAGAVASGATVEAAGMRALLAAEAGRDAVTPLRSLIGRASWIGERTEGQIDPGCAALVVILSALAG